MSRPAQIRVFLVHLCIATWFVATWFVATSAVRSQEILLVEDFESGEVGLFPAGWGDAAETVGRCSVPSVEIAEVEDLGGESTLAARFKEEVCNRSQGLHREIGSFERVLFALDVRVDQFSGAGQNPINDFPIYIGLAELEPCFDPAHSRTVGIFVSSLTRTWQFYDSSGRTCARPDEPGTAHSADTNIPVDEGDWYALELEYDMLAGTLDLRITNLTMAEEFPARRAQFDASGRHASGFSDLLISDGEFSQRSPGGIALVDNILVLDESVDESPSFRRGDCNDDGRVDISDAIFALGSLFLGQGAPACGDACDANDDSRIDISDAISTLGALFLGQGPIPLPGMHDCGDDPTEDELGCALSQCQP